MSCSVYANEELSAWCFQPITKKFNCGRKVLRIYLLELAANFLRLSLKTEQNVVSTNQMVCIVPFWEFLAV